MKKGQQIKSNEQMLVEKMDLHIFHILFIQNTKRKVGKYRLLRP